MRATHFSKIKQAMNAGVRPEMAEVELRTAKVLAVGRVIGAISNRFRVRLELPNPANALPAGLRCKLEFDGLAAVETGAVVATVKPDRAPDPRSEAGAVPPGPEQRARKPAADQAGAKSATGQSAAAVEIK